MQKFERITRSYQAAVIREVTHGDLCPRTLAIWRPGVPMPGVHCWKAYTGGMPCTGRVVCHLCGRDRE